LLDVREGARPSLKKAAQYLVATNPVVTVTRNDPTD